MTVSPLASSSRGNAYLVRDGETHLLLECGLAYRALRSRCPVPLQELTAVAVECNYSEDPLSRDHRMPEKTKNRIRHTHMEGNFLRRLDLTKCTHIYLMHLSGTQGRAQRVHQRFSRAFPGIAVEICRE